MEQAQGSRAPIQRLADRISSIFVPVVLGISLLTFVLWAVPGQVYPTLVIGVSSYNSMGRMNANPWISALVAAITVLVVACPCALGLATPTAIIVGTGKGAERGILIKGGESLERIQAVRAILLDKTGTITNGRPELTDVVALPGRESDELLHLVALADRVKEHAKETIKQLQSRGVDVLMITGDNRRTAQAIATQVGIPAEPLSKATSAASEPRWRSRARR